MSTVIKNGNVEVNIKKNQEIANHIREAAIAKGRVRGAWDRAAKQEFSGEIKDDLMDTKHHLEDVIDAQSAEIRALRAALRLANVQ